ncbi:acyl carrier protein [Actinoplanes missouriensis]|nr:acyl carrier protein [Actinoplanes missouriensis]
MTVSPDPAAVREELRAHLAEVLYLEPDDIADDAGFADLGLDSVLGVELIALINSRYGLAELVEEAYRQGTLANLAEYVCARVAERGAVPS